MSLRFFGLSILLLGVFAFPNLPSVQAAETCVSACPDGTSCRFYEGGYRCVSDCSFNNNCEVSEVVSTGKVNNTFARLVYKVIVPFVSNSVVPLIYALTFIAFLIGMVQFFFLDQSEEGRAKGKNLMLWGVIAFFVMFSVWGLVNLLVSSFAGAVAGSGA
ncbi:MAG: hypothetical protein JWN64_314 [Parcubacteria group bacterium]|nr:hypothetical protein [Parcubacteria group bacterium]